jgi:hypothetical protein
MIIPCGTNALTEVSALRAEYVDRFSLSGILDMVRAFKGMDREGDSPDKERNRRRGLFWVNFFR